MATFCDEYACSKRIFEIKNEIFSCESCTLSKFCHDCFIKAHVCKTCAIQICNRCMQMCDKCDELICNDHCKDGFCESCDEDTESE